MICVGIKELKNQLSRYLALVKEGEEVIITERGKTIARIISEKPSQESLLQQLSPLIADGLVTLPTKPAGNRRFHPIKSSGKTASEMVIEDRR